MPDPIHDDPQEVLRVIGAKLQIVDRHLVGVVAERLALARQVGYAKHRQIDEEHPNGQPISRPEIEDARIADVMQIADEMGVSRHLVAAIVYSLINESCKEQMIQSQQGSFGYGDVDYPSLKRNLLRLANSLAPRYDEHLKTYPATRAYLAFEAEVMEEQIGLTPGRAHALDLGCGVGGVSFRLAPLFDRVTGVDMSDGMVDQAVSRARELGQNKVGFILGDIEEDGIWGSLEDNSVDFVSMNLGMASCIMHTRVVMAQIGRVLRPGGRFLLSFYNADALLYRWFSPWAKSLAAVIDPDRQCLDVSFEGQMLSVYAQAYTLDQVDDLIGRRLQVTQMYAHPTFAAMLPREMLAAADASQTIAELDRAHALGDASDGAYIIAVGRKG